MTEGPVAFEHLRAPIDPRLRWELPAYGQLPVTADLEPLLTRVLAPNPSNMTLDGTNTYLVGAIGSGEVVLVDPGPDDPDHLDRVRAALTGRQAQCVGILVTHHHADHAAAALPWADHFHVWVAAADPGVAGPGGQLLQAGDQLRTAGTTIAVLPTPGHCADHLAFRLESGGVLVGDHVLGRGTSVVTHPEGDVLAYLESLRRVHDLGPAALYPGHGPELTEDPLAVLDYYLAHREFREQQILAMLSVAPQSVSELVAVIYAAVGEDLWPAAEQSTRAALAKLRTEDRVEMTDDRVRLVG